MKFQIKYFIIAIILFLVECLIAIYTHDRFIRPYVGDFLVVILIYCFVKSFLNIRPFPLSVFVLLFSYIVEVSQYFNLARHLGLQHSRIAMTVLGSSFEWLDLVAYTFGVATVLSVETLRMYRSS